MPRKANPETRSQWRSRLQRFSRSGLTVAEFCQREQVSPASFYLWRRRLREPSSASKESQALPAPRFLPVQLSTATGLQVTFPNGIQLEMAGADHQLIRSLIESLATTRGAGRSLMLGLPQGTRIYFCTQPVDFRRGFNGLGGIIASTFEMNVLDGHLFLFVNRRQDRLKALWWEPGGLILWYKRLERGTFEMPRATDGQTHITIDATQLAMLIGGVPLASAVKRRKRMTAA